MKRLLGLIFVFGAALAAGAANLMKGDTSFETGHGPWRVTGDIVQDTAVDGAHCLAFHNDIFSDDTYTLEPDKPHVFTVWLKSGKNSTLVRLQAYRTNWDGRSPQKFVHATPQWQRFTLQIPPQKFGDHNTFWMRVTATDDQEATIFMDAAQLEAAEQPSEYESQEPIPFICDVLAPVQGHIFFTDEPVKLTQNLYNAAKNKKQATAWMKITDYYGATILNTTKDVAIDGKATAVIPVDVPKSPRHGIFFVAYGVKSGDEKAEKHATYCVLEKPAPHKLGDPSFFGICGGTNDRIDACARMGVQAQAIALRWAYMTPDKKLSPGQAKGIISLADKLISVGIEPIVYFRRTPPWATVRQSSTDIYPPKEEFIKDYETFCYLGVQLLKGRATTFQLWGGEADLLCDNVKNTLGWSHEQFVDMVVALCKAGYTGAKRANPNCIIEPTSVSGVDCTHAKFPFLSAVLEKARGFYDKAACHPYCYPSRFDGDRYVQSPEENNIVNDYRTLSKIAGGKMVTNGEYGFSIKPTEPFDSKASRTMGAFLARSFLLTASCMEVDRLMYYTVANSDEFSVFGWPNPRVPVAAYSALSRRLTGRVSAKELAMGSLAKAYVYGRKDGSAMAAIWIPKDKAIDFALAKTDGIDVVDMMGNPVENPANVTLTGEPTYFCTSKSAAELEAVLTASKLLIAPVSVEVRPRDSRTLVFYVANQLNEELDGAIDVTVPTKTGRRKFTLPLDRLRSSVQEKRELAIPEGIDFKALDGKTIDGAVKTRQGDTPIHEKFQFMSCPRAPKNVAIDGDLSEWNGRKAIVLNTTASLFPPDAMTHGLWKGAADLSVKAYIGWDKEFFYFAACVYDDIFVNNSPAETLWNGDCIQMAFDPLNDARVKNYERDDCEFNISFSSKTNGTCVSRTWPLPFIVPKSVKGAAKVGKGCIIYEMAIPFEAMPDFKPARGKVFRYNFVATDNDLKHNDYWMGISYGICGGKDPSAFPVFVME